MEKLDIMFMFKKMVKDDENEGMYYLNNINMSEECKHDIKEVYKA